MPYYLTSVAELPYPHTMGERSHRDGTRSNCPLALEAVLRTLGQHPGQDGSRELFTNDAISHAALNHAPFANLTAADRRLTLALLSYSDSLRIYTNGHGQRETIGQRALR